ncbi:MAG: arsenate reductase/protein-tyrosine-phosphatase family protein [Promethearchaeota archaeon]
MKGHPVSVLFVCLGNTCRSPAAEYYAKKWALDRAGAENWRFESAGFNGFFGTAQQETRRILWEEEGMDMSGFKSRVITREMASGFDYVVVMERYQRDDVFRILGGGRGSGKAPTIVTLKELAGVGDGDITDPYMMEFEQYRRILHEIKELVWKALDGLLVRQTTNAEGSEA